MKKKEDIQRGTTARRASSTEGVAAREHGRYSDSKSTHLPIFEKMRTSLVTLALCVLLALPGAVVGIDDARYER